MLTQMRRWGQITESKPDSWYHDVAKKVYRPDIYLEAAKMLIAEGKAKKADFPFDADGYRPPQTECRGTPMVSSPPRRISSTG